MDVKKTNNYLRDLYASIVMDEKKPTTIYKTYMRVLQWMKKNQQIFMKPICEYYIFEMFVWKL